MKFIFGYLLIIGAIFSFIIPPFQKPDETVHFKKAVAISYGIFNCSKNGKIQVNKQFIDLVQQKSLQSIIAKKIKVLNLNQWFNQINNTKPDNKLGLLESKNSCQLPTVAYIPQVTGLLFSKIINLNAFWSFFMGRFFGFLVFFAWFYFLHQHSSKSIKKIILLTFALPMTLHQLTSYSYDGIQIMLSLTVFVAGTKLIENRLKKINWLIVLILGLIGFLVSRTIVKVAYPATANPLAQLELLKVQPLSILEIIVKTTYVRFLFYLQGLIGIFGWLEYGLDYFTYFFYIFLIGFVICQTKLGKKILLLKWQNFILGFVIFIYYLALLFINFLFWTPYKSKVVDGIQGRYFIIIFPFLIYFLINIRQRYFPKFKIIKFFVPNWLIAVLGVTIITLIFRSIFLRFYGS